jgi:hypothetical protein
MVFQQEEIMKILSTILIATLALVSSCSSPKERNEQRQAEAKKQYDQKLKQSQEQYEKDEMNVKRDQAKDMIDKSDSVEVNKDKGDIKVDD